jgi:hypothetical protein
MNSHSDQAWTTGDELRFLAGIGRWSEPGKKSGARELLRGYLQGVKRRADWAGIDTGTVIREARKAYRSRQL